MTMRLRLPTSLPPRSVVRHSRARTSLGTAAILAGATLACLLLGSVVAALSLPAVVMVVFGITGVTTPVLLAFRHAFSPVQSWPSGHLSVVASSSGNVATSRTRGDFRVPRLLYYLGMVFIAQLTFRPALSSTLSDWFFLAALLAACFEVASAKRHVGTSIPVALIVAMGVFSLGGIASSVSAYAPLASVSRVMVIDYLILAWLWLGTVVLRDLSHIRVALALWLVSASATGLSGVAQLLLGDVVPGGSINWGRATGFTPHVNDLGGVTAIAVVVAFALAAQPRNRGWLRALAIFAAFATAGGLIASGAVAGFAAGGIGSLAFLAAGRNQLRGIVLLVCAVIAVSFVVAVQQGSGASTPLARLELTTADPNNPNSTFWTRVDVNGSALSSIAQNPLIGVGLDSVSARTDKGLEVHNIILGPWFESGLFGMLGVVIACTTVLFVARRATTQARSSEESAIVLALVVAFVAFLVFGMADIVLYRRYGWIAAALLLAIRAQQRHLSGLELAVPSESRLQGLGGTKVDGRTR